MILGFNPPFINITTNKFKQSLNVTELLQEQFKWLLYKLPNYTMVNYYSLKEQIQQIDDNHPYNMPNWLIIFITVLGTLITITCIVIFLYCKYRCVSNESKTSLCSSARGIKGD